MCVGGCGWAASSQQRHEKSILEIEGVGGSRGGGQGGKRQGLCKRMCWWEAERGAHPGTGRQLQSQGQGGVSHGRHTQQGQLGCSGASGGGQVQAAKLVCVSAKTWHTLQRKKSTKRGRRRRLAPGQAPPRRATGSLVSVPGRARQAAQRARAQEEKASWPAKLCHDNLQLFQGVQAAPAGGGTGASAPGAAGLAVGAGPAAAECSLSDSSADASSSATRGSAAPAAASAAAGASPQPAATPGASAAVPAAGAPLAAGCVLANAGRRRGVLAVSKKCTMPRSAGVQSCRESAGARYQRAMLVCSDTSPAWVVCAARPPTRTRADDELLGATVQVAARHAAVTQEESVQVACGGAASGSGWGAASSIAEAGAWADFQPAVAARLPASRREGRCSPAP